MSGCFGGSDEDRWIERQLMDYLYELDYEANDELEDEEDYLYDHRNDN